jgi:hypothetical protein
MGVDIESRLVIGYIVDNIDDILQPYRVAVSARDSDQHALSGTEEPSSKRAKVSSSDSDDDDNDDNDDDGDDNVDGISAWISTKWPRWDVSALSNHWLGDQELGEEAVLISFRPDRPTDVWTMSFQEMLTTINDPGLEDEFAEICSALKIKYASIGVHALAWVCH